MNLWLRLVWLYLTRRRRGRIEAPLGVSLLNLMVLPNDLDLYGHVNNGRYLTLMDLGRMDLFLRGGLYAAVRRENWNPVLSAAKVRFRREMRLWRRFRLETRIVYWEETTFVMEHRIFIAGEAGRELLATHALMRGGLYDVTGRAFVPVARLFERMGIDAKTPDITEDVRAFLDAEDAMRRAI